MQKRESERIEERLKSTPAVHTLLSIARDFNANLFLGGGALRDLMLGAGDGADLDLYLQCNQETFEKMSEQISKHPECLQSMQSGKIDLQRARHVPQYVQQFDFTINTMVYDVGEKQLLCNETAAQDLAACRLRITSLPFFAASFRSFVRGFRLAQSRNLQIDAGYIEAVRDFGGVLGLCDAAMHATVIGELFHLLSLPDLGAVWGGLEESRLVVHLFPFLVGLERRGDEANSLRSNFRALRALDFILATLPETTVRRLTMLHEVPHRFGGKLYIAKLSELGVVRLSLLFANMGQAWIALGPGLESPFNTTQFAANTAKTFLLETTRSLAAHPAIEQAFSIAADISQRGQHARQQLWSKTATHLESLGDPHLRRLLALHLLALQLGGQRIYQGDPEPSLVERALRSNLAV